MEFFNDTINILLPEINILLFIFVQIILSMFVDARFYKLAKWISILGIFCSIGWLTKVQIEPIYYGLANSLISDSYTLFFQCLILIASVLIIFLTKGTLASNRENAFNFHALLLTAILGGLLLVSSNDFLTMFIAMETLSISTGLLISLGNKYVTKEAAFKYVITSAVASSIFLFGVSYIYGMTGSVNFDEIYDFFGKQNPILLYSMSAIFIVSGLMFKLGATPFANWIVDVYEGGETSVITFLSIVPKVAMFGVLTRLLVFPLSYSFELTFAIVIISVITAIWANHLALRQKNIKKILACSSSANASYMLFVASLVSVYNLSTVLFYLIAYIFMNIGVFAAIIILESSNFSNKLYEFKNFAYTNPVFTMCFSLCILGLAGLPLTGGFISKLYLFTAIVRSGLVFLPFLAILLFMIVISMYYYLNIIKLMFEKTEKNSNEVIPHKVSSAIIILYSCAIITLLIGILPNKLIELCQIIAYNL